LKLKHAVAGVSTDVKHVERTIDSVEEKRIQKKRTTVHRLAVFAAAAAVVVVVAAVAAAVALVAVAFEDWGLEEPVGHEALESGLAVVACLEGAGQEGKSKQGALDEEVAAR
jgi:hypothetical protein